MPSPRGRRYHCRVRRGVTIAAVTCLLAGCVDRSVGSDEEASTESDVSSEPGEPESTTGEPDLPDESVCLGDDEAELEARLIRDPEGAGTVPAEAGDVACIYANVEELDGGGRRYAFVTCETLSGEPEPNYALDSRTAPDIEPIVDQGTVVRIRFEALAEAWVITAQPGGLLLFAGQTGEWAELDVSPLSLARETTGCEARVDDCGSWDPEALVVEAEGQSDTLLAGDSAVVGESVQWRVNLGRFESAVSEPSCPFEPEAHYEFIVGLLPSDSSP